MSNPLGLSNEQRIRIMQMAWKACSEEDVGPGLCGRIVAAYDMMVEAVLDNPADVPVDWLEKLNAIQAYYGSVEKEAIKLGVNRVSFYRFKTRGIGLQKHRDLVDSFYQKILPELRECGPGLGTVPEGKETIKMADAG